MKKALCLSLALLFATGPIQAKPFSKEKMAEFAAWITTTALLNFCMTKASEGNKPAQMTLKGLATAACATGAFLSGLAVKESRGNDNLAIVGAPLACLFGIGTFFAGKSLINDIITSLKNKKTN